jgi:hypothetical protein
MKERRKMMPSAFCTTDRDESAKSEEKSEAGRLETMGDLDAAALRLRDAVRMVLDSTYADDAERAAVFSWIARPQLEQDVATAGHVANRFMAATFSSRIAIPLASASHQISQARPTLLSESAQTLVKFRRY